MGANGAGLILGLDHLTLAVARLDEAVTAYEALFAQPCAARGQADGLALRDLIARNPTEPVHLKVRLDVDLVPNLKTATIWGSLPGTTDETVFVVAHRDGWFEGANESGQPMWDSHTGGGYDGLGAAGVDRNQGALSTLAVVSTLQNGQRFLDATE